jgi:glycosyltransferase involved in cell wall biosynthesis
VIILQELVSVIMPVYNSADYLHEAVNSVLSQSYDPVELIIVDDASTDNSGQILAEISLRVPGLRVVRLNENIGAAGARNAGLSVARGEFVSFIDADDVWLPEKTSRQVEVLIGDTEAGWVYCNGFIIKQDMGVLYLFSDCGHRPAGMVYDQILRGSLWIVPSSIMVRRNVLDECGHFDPELRSVEDWEFLLRVARKYKCGYLAETLIKYRQHTESVSRKEERMLPGRQKVLEKLLPLHPELESMLRHNYHRSIGIGMLGIGETKSARVNFLKAVRYGPFDYRVWAGLFLSILPEKILLKLINAKKRLIKKPLF